jgi:hypothetical protein
MLVFLREEEEVDDTSESLARCLVVEDMKGEGGNEDMSNGRK